MGLEGRTKAAPVLSRLRQATGDLHQRLERRFDAVAELADPARRQTTIARYAAFYTSAYAALAAPLEHLEGLDLAERSRTWQPGRSLSPCAGSSPAFPAPTNASEALGSLYVVEGSALGGRLILRELRARRVPDADVSFLDPHGPAGGSMWRSLLAILEREGSRSPAHLESMCRGAIRGFAHAERILCGEVD